MIKALLWAAMVIFTLGSVFAASLDYAEGSNKVTICHFPPGNPENIQTIDVAASSLPAHFAHGDYEGECEIESEEIDGESNPEDITSEDSTNESLGQNSIEEITEDENQGGENAWDTRPTFVVNHETRAEQVVDSGFMFNGNFFTINDNHHTEFEEQTILVGTTNSFAAKVYASKGLKVQEFLFGVPSVGNGHLAELGIEVWYNHQGEIQDIKVAQETLVIDPASITVQHSTEKCKDSDIKKECDVTFVSMRFLEPLKDKVMAIKAIDFKNRDQTTYLNDGFDVSGESLNEMPSQMIASPQKGEGLVKVTQTAKYSSYWIAQDGRTFEKNSFDSFTQVNKEFERLQDKGEPRTRQHSGFAEMVLLEQTKASLVFDSSSITSELPESLTIEYPETEKRIDAQMMQKMSIQEQIAQKIMGELTN